MSSHNTIALIIPYFGKFPEWAPLYFETIRRNSSIDFLFYTDCDFSSYQHISNCIFHKIRFEDYLQNARELAGIEFNPANAYKLCDLRPLYPIIHYADIREYDFYGWTDMDILYGDIRLFYTDDLLAKYDVFSAHEVRISGHFALFRNIEKYRNAYKKIYCWREHLAFPEFVGIDEHGITNALTMTFFDRLNEKMNWNLDNFLTRWLKKRKMSRLYMVEQYTTPFITTPWLDGSKNCKQPDVWFYKDGKITNSRDVDRNFIYLHFMNFKSSQWRHDGTPAPWEGKEHLYTASKEDMKYGIIIDQKGIHKLS
jgi:hypothetical protein